MTASPSRLLMLAALPVLVFGLLTGCPYEEDATVVVDNFTNLTAQVYINGRYQGIAGPNDRLTITDVPVGRTELFAETPDGNFTWGPVSPYLFDDDRYVWSLN